MNAINKRLLSWLCAIAMVLSLVPVMDLSGFAIETKAADIVYGSANLPSGVQAVMDKGNNIDDSDAGIQAHIDAGTCPMCGATGITWTANKGSAPANKGHVYYDGEVTTTGNLLAVTASTHVMCMALKSTANISTAHKITATNGGTVNIMGTGTVTSTIAGATGPEVITVSGGNVNLYGGTFRAQNAPTNSLFGVIRVYGAGNTDIINIWDGVVIGPETKGTATAMNIVVHNTGTTINMYGGTIQNGVAAAVGYSGNVCIGNSAVFNMYGGTIKDGSFASGVNGFGGNVLVGASSGSASPATFNMYGGTVSGGTAYYGANICTYQASATATISGGTVSGGNGTEGGSLRAQAGTLNVSGTAKVTGGTATSIGGNIAGSGSGIVNISGGLVEKGEAPNGGNIRANGTLTVSGTAVISEGTATTGLGGNIYVNSTKVTITGGTIQNGKAPRGGNIVNDQALTISGGTIKDGAASNTSFGGGNIYANNTLTINGTAQLAGGSATYGGSIFVVSGKTTTISGGTVSGGSATNGGNIHVAGTLNVDGTGIITEGTATTNGGNINIGSTGVVNVKNGAVSDGYAKSLGGNILVGHNAAGVTGTLNVTGGTISGGEAGTAGGNVMVQANFKMSAGTITEGFAGTSGGNIGCNDVLGVIAITGGSITDGVAGSDKYETAGFGGNIAISRGTTHSITGATITGGTVYGQVTDGKLSNGDGGNIGVHDAGTGAALTISNSTISGGAADVGGNIGTKGATLTIDADCVVSAGSDRSATGANLVGFASDNFYLATASGSNLGSSSAITEGLSIEEDALTISGQEVTAELNGLTMSVNGTGTVNGLDSANDSYDEAACGALTVVDGITVNAEAEDVGNNYRYISLPNDDDTWSFHRVDLRLTHVTLRTTHPDAPKYNGIYYKSILYADDTVGDAVASYGVAVDLTSMPDENFMLDGNNYTAINGPITFGDAHCVTMNSGAVNNIVQSSNSTTENASNLASKIYANPYVAITRGDSTYNMMGNQDVSYSLHDVLTAINTGWADYTEEQQTMVQENLAHWVDWFEAGALSVYDNIF